MPAVNQMKKPHALPKVSQSLAVDMLLTRLLVILQFVFPLTATHLAADQTVHCMTRSLHLIFLVFQNNHDKFKRNTDTN